jgi:3-hydroxyisobutyrate dehydrogenase-like beta-hydroxyacid dehydrogenase
MSAPTIGFVGVGRMGGPMSQRLIDAGHALHVFDANAEATAVLKKAGAAAASSPEDVGNNGAGQDEHSACSRERAGARLRQRR